MSQEDTKLESCEGKSTSNPEQVQSLVRGERLLRAQSSLGAFAVYFESGRALVLQGAMSEFGPDIEVELKPSTLVPEQSEAVCSVNWSWIYGRTVKNLKKRTGGMGAAYGLDLGDGLVITISVGLWEGKPFLSFMPYKPQ